MGERKRARKEKISLAQSNALLIVTVLVGH